MFSVIRTDSSLPGVETSHMVQPRGYEITRHASLDEEEMEEVRIHQRNDYFVSDRTLRERRLRKQRLNELMDETKWMVELKEAAAENNRILRQILEEERKFVFAQLDAALIARNKRSGLARIVFWGCIVVGVGYAAYLRLTEASPKYQCNYVREDLVKSCKWN